MIRAANIRVAGWSIVVSVTSRSLHEEGGHLPGRTCLDAAGDFLAVCGMNRYRLYAQTKPTHDVSRHGAGLMAEPRLLP